ncbi:MAG: Gfo/Idh/MocA family oxidoreductase [Sedimentisphaerales bacterium]|nr:Gfo/Idh/MocA family oxidoreductase [Sedimentisphaerales bacterium]
MKRFALIGAAGYIAPRHLKAIKDTGNILVAALDRSDSVGVLDSYFPDADFFTEFERFDRHLEKLRRADEKQAVDYVTICSPNYLHDAHVRFALRIGANAICEKPLVLNPWNVDALEEIERESKGKINTILQLRLHPAIIELKKKVDSDDKKKIHDIDITYITSRGHWYMASWKGDIHKSGGIATNIGIHFFDMLAWVFGDVKKNVVHLSQMKRAAGYMELEKARVRWFLSLEKGDLPVKPEPGKPMTYRSVVVDDQEVEFSEGFGDLHTESYKKILAGKGFSTRDVITSVQIASDIRTAEAVGLKGDFHPILKTIKL